MGFSLGSLAGGLVGFALGGPAGAAIGAGLGTKASGGSTEDALLAGGLGYLGGAYLPGMDLGGAAAGAGAAEAAGAGSADAMLAAQTAGFTPAELAGWGGATQADLLGAQTLGFSPADLGGWGGMTAADFGSASSAFGGVPVVDAVGVPSAGITGPAATPMDILRRRMQMLGMGGGGAGGTLGMVGGGLNILSGLYGMNAAQQMSQMAQRADPFAGYRPQYAQQLQQLTMDPSRITSMPGYRAGLQAVQRSMAAQGYQGSGNMMAALSKYGGDFYGQEVNRLATLGGAGISPQIALQGQGMAADLTSRGLASLGYGTRMMGMA